MRHVGAIFFYIWLRNLSTKKRFARPQKQSPMIELVDLTKLGNGEIW